MRFTRYTLKAIQFGGAWLAAARNWIKWHKLNGSTVTWCSDDELRPTMTVAQVEDLAADITLAVINDLMDKGYLTQQFINDAEKGLLML